MSNVATLRSHLERCFEDHRLVFWHDPEHPHNGKSDVGKRTSL